jgi:TPR repeat protein
MRGFSTLVLAVFLMLFATVAWSGDVQKGWDAYNSLDYATAKAEWQEPADSGDARAAYGMGMLYANGFGVDMNDDLALKYYGIAAEKGSADAQFNLAVMHQNGWGVPPDEALANEWYRMAAEQGNTQAQMALGRYYAMDFLDTYDPVEAYKWFSLAEKLGEIDASYKREFVAARMTPEQVLQADGLVETWLKDRKAILAGIPTD